MLLPTAIPTVFAWYQYPKRRRLPNRKILRQQEESDDTLTASAESDLDDLVAVFNNAGQSSVLHWIRQLSTADSFLQMVEASCTTNVISIQ